MKKTILSLILACIILFVITCSDDNGTSNPAADADNDGVVDESDNCINTANPEQADADNDGIGDACDNCADTVNPDQEDMDNDWIGDVCDDDKDLLALTGEALKNAGYDVFLVDKGTKAIEELRRWDIDLIILDVKMAEMHGVEVLKEIRKINSTIPVIIFTSYPPN